MPRSSAELEALVREHPLRERLRAQLMLALYRSGRQAEALDAYQAGRTLLLDELGLEPGAELKELQRAILEHDGTRSAQQPQRPSRRTIGTTRRARRVAADPSARGTKDRDRALRATSRAVGTELDPESLAPSDGPRLRRVAAVLERHGATVERSLGGAVTAIFGIPSCTRTTRCALCALLTEMRERLAGAAKSELERPGGRCARAARGDRDGRGPRWTATGDSRTRPVSRCSRRSGCSRPRARRASHRRADAPARPDSVDVEATRRAHRRLVARPPGRHGLR